LTLYAIAESRTATKEGAIGYGRLTIRLCGIYKLDGEKLVLCLPEAEVSPLLRPAEFKGDGEGGVYLLTYKRASKNWKPDVRMTPTTTAPESPPVVPKISDDEIKPARDKISAPEPPTVAPAAGPLPPPPQVLLPDNPPLPPRTESPVPTVDLPPSAPLPPAVGPSGSSVPPTALVPPPSDLDRLQGSWSLKQRDGKPPSPSDRAHATEPDMTYVKDRVLEGDGVHGRFHLDERMTPKRITFDMPKQEEPKTAIYRLDGDTLVIAYHNRSSKLIPIDFEPDEQSGVTVEIYERVKGDPPTKKKPAADVPRADRVPEPPARRTDRDIQKEVDQLREQLKRLEQELKDRKPPDLDPFAIPPKQPDKK
jgi:uncharacterized protein (TIGR03067 family)